MAENKTISVIIGLAVVLLLIGILLPIGLTDLTGYTGFYNATHVVDGTTTYVSGTNTTMGSLIGTILPVMAVIGIIMGMVSTMRKDGGVD